MRKLLIIGLLFFCSVSWGQNLFLKDSQNRQVYFDKEFVKWLNFFESRYVQLIPNGPLVDIFGGNASLPYVSGFGVDQIFDLSPLSDNRWNKNAYIGNGFGLPEYYDFPYSFYIYYDAGNPYHWKIKDFHYRYYEEQNDSLTNIGFAKLTYDNYGYGAICESSGEAYNNSSVAYGVWEFSIIHSTGVNTIVPFIADLPGGDLSSNGYWLAAVTNNRVWFYANGVGGVNRYPLFRTNFQLTSGVLYGFRITRAINNQFTVEIRGGIFGDTYSLITDLEFGTNPVTDNSYTISNYTVIDFSANTSIRNYYIDGVLQNFKRYTVSSGSFKIDNLRSADELLLYTEEQTLPELPKIKSFINLTPPNYIYYENEE